MDEVDMVTKRRSRPKDSFQNELQSKLRQRKSLGLSAEITDSEEEVVASPRNMDFLKSRAARPSSAKRRSDQPQSLSQGLGTTTMRTRDLSTLLGRGDDYDEDEEIIAANLGRSGGSSGRLPSPGMKSPSPKMESGYLRKSGSPKDTGKLDSIYGRKTPTKDSSPRTGQLSKEDIIFGRKTPSDERKSPSDSSKSKLPGMDAERSWQPPSFRTASPGLSEHSRGSRGVTPVDATLDTISETPREKHSSRSPLGQKPEASPRQLAVMGERPKPQARSRVGDAKTPPMSKTPPLVDPRRKSPSSPSTETQGLMKRTTPTMDLFGGRNRELAAEEVKGYIDMDKKGKLGGVTLDGKKTPDGKKISERDRPPEGRSQMFGKGRVASPTGRFTRDGRKTPIDKAAELDRKTPTGRKTPSELQKKSSVSKTASVEEKDTRQSMAGTGSSLLDFLTEGSRPKPQERKKKLGQSADDDLDGLLEANRRALGEKGVSPEFRKLAEGRKSPTPKSRASAPVRPKSSGTSLEEQQPPPSEFKQQRPEDTSSMCEEIPPDPNRKVAREELKAGSGKQRSERVQSDNVIDMVNNAQTMQYIHTAKKVRPVTADAKVQHRPKPRYGLLPGETKPEERQFNSTSDIRDAIYEEWYKERMKLDRKKKKQEEERQKKKEEEEKQKKNEKRQEADASYQAWLKEKKHKAHEKMIEDHKKKEQQREEEENEQNKKDTGSYEAWKKTKIAQIRQENRKKAEEERAKKEEEDYKKKLEKEERSRAHADWVRKKQRALHSENIKRKEDSRSKKEKEQETEEELRRKKMESEDKYYEWIAKKEESKRKEKKLAKQRTMIDNERPAFFPASRTIPFGR